MYMTNEPLTRQEFISQLEAKLGALPEHERKSTLDYYDNHIKNSPDEAATIRTLGLPSDVATEILTSYVRREAYASSSAYVPPRKSNNKWIIIVLVAIFAGPLILGLGGGLFGAVVGFVTGGVALIITGVASLILSVYVLFQDFGFGLIAAGTGLASIGIGILLVQLTILIVKGVAALVKGVARRVQHG